MARFTGSSGNDVADAGTGSLSGFSGGSVAELQDNQGDIFDGLNGDDRIVAGLGDDVLRGGLGADTLNGGAGIDTAAYDDDFGAVFVNLTLGRGFGNAAQDDRLIGIENLIGSRFNDYFIGDDGANRLDGGAGDDTLIGALGADVLIGGTGNDTASYESNQGSAFVNLTLGRGFNNAAEGDTLEGIENLRGGLDPDYFIGNASANILDGGAGDDTLIGAGGADTLIGGTGVDTASYQEGANGVTVNLVTGLGSGGNAQGDRLIGIENIIGSRGSDFLIGDSGANVLDGGFSGGDRLMGGLGADVLIGAGVNFSFDTAMYTNNPTGMIFDFANNNLVGAEIEGDRFQGIDRFEGSRFDDVFFAGTAVPGAVGDSFVGDEGNDRFTGDSRNNFFDGGNGNDFADGGAGNDILTLGAGDDFIIGGAGADRIEGGAGIDTLSHAGETEGVFVHLAAGVGFRGFAEGDRYDRRDIENVIGSNGDDVIFGTNSDNRLEGGAGDDFLTGDLGADTLIGGDGADTVNYGGFYFARAGVKVDLTTGRGSVNSGANDPRFNPVIGDTYDGIENIVGSRWDDALIGNNGDNVLDGGGYETEESSNNNDLMTGNGGADTFAFGTRLRSNNIDTITDFVSGTDRIRLDSVIFAALGGGTLPANAFATGSAATTADHRIIYNQATGALFYDADGSGAGAAVQFATLSGNPPIASTDFFVI